LVVMLALLSGSGRAASEAVVEAVQSPAWIERSSGREPLAVGMELRNGDRVVSGAEGKVLLRLAEGSAVRLGEQAQLAIDRLALRREPGGGVMTAALDVLKGAFRFTTQASNRFRGRREVDVRIATVTAGIRGTDLWGKAAPDRDIVCLIEGRISVQRQGDAQFTMDQPRSFYIAPRNAPPLPVQPVPPQQLEQWSTETDIAPGQGGARRGGRWNVYVADADDQSGALAAYDALRAAGYPAQIRPLDRDGRTIYRVRVGNLPNRADAERLAAKVRALPGLAEARVERG
jgi:hypothetical protein